MNQSSLIILIFINIFQITLPFPLLLSNRDNEFYGINSKRIHLIEPTDENKENEKQNPPKIKKWEFLDFKVDTIEELAQIGDKKCSCGKYFLKHMKKIEYGDWHFRVWPKAIGGGAASNIFHAHQMSPLKDFNGKRLQLEKCVALKSVLLEKVGKVFAEEMRNEIRILKKFAQLKSKRVIRLFAFKDLHLINQLLLLMEMGEYDLFEEFKNMRKIIENIWRLNKEQNEKLIEIEEIIKNKLIEILEAVKEMHKLAIHLDLKPENLLYVKEADGKGGHKMTLKVIDFGGSELIPEKNSKINVEKRANVCKWRQRMWYSRLYTSPEQTEYCNNFPNHYEFSIKSDIWAVGVILLKMIMLVPMIQNGITDEYVDYAISLFVEMCRIDNCLNNIENQQFALRDNLIIIRDKFLEYFNILKVTLNIMPKERPTSRGLLDFLAEICQLKLPQNKMEKLKSAFNYGIGKILGHKILPECDLQTTGNPLTLSDEVKSNEIELKEIIVI